MVRSADGGIGRLLSLPREQWEALEARLFDRGFTLEDLPHRINWRILVNWMKWPWNPSDYIQALGVDYLAFLGWAKTKDAQKNQNRPKPIERPGHDQSSMKAQINESIRAAQEAGW